MEVERGKEVELMAGWIDGWLEALETLSHDQLAYPMRLSDIITFSKNTLRPTGGFAKCL